MKIAPTVILMAATGCLFAQEPEASAVNALRFRPATFVNEATIALPSGLVSPFGRVPATQVSMTGGIPGASSSGSMKDGKEDATAAVREFFVKTVTGVVWLEGGQFRVALGSLGVYGPKEPLALSGTDSKVILETLTASPSKDGSERSVILQVKVMDGESKGGARSVEIQLPSYFAPRL